MLCVFFLLDGSWGKGFISFVEHTYGCQPKNRGGPKTPQIIPCLIGFGTIIFTIHFGGVSRAMDASRLFGGWLCAPVCVCRVCVFVVFCSTG